MAAVWQDSFVEEGNVAKQILATPDGDGRGTDLIETIPNGLKRHSMSGSI